MRDRIQEALAKADTPAPSTTRFPPAEAFHAAVAATALPVSDDMVARVLSPPVPEITEGNLRISDVIMPI